MAKGSYEQLIRRPNTSRGPDEVYGITDTYNAAATPDYYFGDSLSVGTFATQDGPSVENIDSCESINGFVRIKKIKIKIINNSNETLEFSDDGCGTDVVELLRTLSMIMMRS